MCMFLLILEMLYPSIMLYITIGKCRLIIICTVYSLFQTVLKFIYFDSHCFTVEFIHGLVFVQIQTTGIIETFHK